MKNDFSLLGVFVITLLFIPVIGALMMFIHVMFGCLMGHAAEWAFGDTLRPALKGMFGWDLPLGHVGAAFGFIYSWFSLLSLARNAREASK